MSQHGMKTRERVNVEAKPRRLSLSNVFFLLQSETRRGQRRSTSDEGKY